MESNMATLIRQTVFMFIIMTVLTGLLYPGLVTFLGQAFFPHQANGSLIESNGKSIGSELIGQNFQSPGYFWGRLSATSPMPYNGASSSGSNLGPTNPALIDEIKGRITALHAADSTNSIPVPVDLATSSGSGLDPHISVAAALYQLPRIAHARQTSVESLRLLLNKCIEGRQFGILGEPRVNVLLLNLELDKLYPNLSKK